MLSLKVTDPRNSPVVANFCYVKSMDLVTVEMAPSSGLISRDRFVALSMRLFTEVKIRLASEIPGLTTEQAMQAMECREVVPSENKIEYSYQVKMTHDGVESRIKNIRRGTEHVTSEPWSVVLRNQPKGK
ncbi:MAG: hypothetical protein J7L69_10825 [Desulfobulbaceae bacterium]|nr:hypothetical protein [Desulfobulbaceae bacterium]